MRLLGDSLGPSTSLWNNNYSLTKTKIKNQNPQGTGGGGMKSPEKPLYRGRRGHRRDAEEMIDELDIDDFKKVSHEAERSEEVYAD